MRGIPAVAFGAQQSASKKRIVIAGNGIGGTTAAKELDRLLHKTKVPGVEITIIGRNPNYVFKPFLPDMLHGEATSIPMKTIFPEGGQVQFRQTSITQVQIDARNKVVETDSGPIPYDYLIMAVGSKTAYYNIKGAETHALPLEDPTSLEKIKASAVKKIDKAAKAPPGSKAQQDNLSFLIVGAGATGIEIAFELNQFIKSYTRQKYPGNPHLKHTLTLLEARNEILPGFHNRDRAYVTRRLKQEGIRILFNHAVKVVRPDNTMDVIDRTHPKQPVEKKLDIEDPIWVTGVTASPLVEKLPVEKLPGNNRVIVNPFLELPNRSDIYFIGDIAAAVNPKTRQVFPTLGQVAEQQGRYVARDLMDKLAENKTRSPFTYNDKGMMLSVGPTSAFVRPSNWFSMFSIKYWLGHLVRAFIYRQKLKDAARPNG